MRMTTERSRAGNLSRGSVYPSDWMEILEQTRSQKSSPHRSLCASNFPTRPDAVQKAASSSPTRDSSSWLLLSWSRDLGDPLPPTIIVCFWHATLEVPPPSVGGPRNAHPIKSPRPAGTNSGPQVLLVPDASLRPHSGRCVRLPWTTPCKLPQEGHLPGAKNMLHPQGHATSALVTKEEKLGIHRARGLCRTRKICEPKINNPWCSGICGVKTLQKICGSLLRTCGRHVPRT